LPQRLGAGAGQGDGGGQLVQQLLGIRLFHPVKRTAPDRFQCGGNIAVGR
jgi:hypothetical protein